MNTEKCLRSTTFMNCGSYQFGRGRFAYKDFKTIAIMCKLKKYECIFLFTNKIRRCGMSANETTLYPSHSL